MVRAARPPARHGDPAPGRSRWGRNPVDALAGGSLDSERLVSARGLVGRDSARARWSVDRSDAQRGLGSGASQLWSTDLGRGQVLGHAGLPWAVENGLPGVWLTPLLQDEAVVTAVERAQQATLLVGGSADPHWRRLAEAGSGVEWMELPHADHGLQVAGDWQRSLLEQIPVFERVNQLAGQLLRSTVSDDVSPTTP